MKPSMDLEALLAHVGWVRALSVDMLGDAQHAEDVVQETLIAALQKKGGPRWSERSMRAWLAQVTRNFARTSMRREARRRAREESQASPEAQPPASEPLERIELQQKTAAAVLALGSPDREIIALRYFEELPPREIARKLGMSPSAVHSRLHRSRRVLRELLVGQYHEEGRHWGMVALAWTSRPSTSFLSPQTALAGGILMKTLATTAALALLVLGWVFGSDWLREKPIQPQGETALRGPSMLATTAAKSVGLVTPLPQKLVSGTTRNEAQPDEPATLATESRADPERATIRVQVTGPKGHPAEGIGLSLRMQEVSTNWMDDQRKVTDAKGSAQFTTIPGDASITIHRAGLQGQVDWKQLEVEAGRSYEVDVQLGEGESLRGRVLDHLGRTVADAAIWLGDGNGAPIDGSIVARSDSDGEFELHHVTELQGLAARAPGYAPSRTLLPLIFPEVRNGEPVVELVLPALGGTLVGTVVDRNQRPITNARIVAIQGTPGSIERDQGRPTYAPPSTNTRTNSRGEFRMDGLAAGTVRIRARAPGTDVVELSHDIPLGGVGRVRIELGSPAWIVGTVRDFDGTPVEGAEIGLTSREPLLGGTVLSDAAGRFSLEEVPVGRVSVTVFHPSKPLTVEAELETVADQETHWEVAFRATNSLEGSVVDSSGAPLTGWFVWREPVAELDEHFDAGSLSPAKTDREGRFQAPYLAPGTYTLTIGAEGYETLKQTDLDPLMRGETRFLGRLEMVATETP